MHSGIVECSEDTPLRELAGLMADHRVHAVVLTGGPDGRPIGVVSDLDVIGAIARGGELSAREVAATEPLSVSAEQPLDRAVELMAAHELAHLVVRDEASGRPAGVLSTLDIAAVYAAAPDAA